MSAVSRESLVSGDYVMTAEDLRRITALLYESSGIVMNQAKATLVYSRLAKRLRKLGLDNFRQYCQLVGSVEGADERKQMLSALTTNLTRFFREPHHFRDLRERVLPALLPGLRQGGRVRVWSAGCSNGAEPYSIAMTLLDAVPSILDYDLRILATDIDFRMVEAGREGVYDAEQVKDAPRQLVSRWMVPMRDESGPTFSAGEEMRKLVSFRELNLIGDWPMKGGFDVIFCRNVAIYFDEETQSGIWAHFVQKLVPGGQLYIGHSERIVGPAQALLRNVGVTAYQLTKVAA